MFSLVLFFLACGCVRQKLLIDGGWRFQGNSIPSQCGAKDFPTDLTNKQCSGLVEQKQYDTLDGCISGCCTDAHCQTYQWCPKDSTGDCFPKGSCWIGSMNNCKDQSGWQSRGRPDPNPNPKPGPNCDLPECKINFDDSKWRTLSIPHDYVVEGNFSETKGDLSHGYMPGSTAWYRLKFDTPKGASTKSVWIYFEGVQRDCDVYLNEKHLGHHDSGYTGFRFPVTLIEGETNVLAVYVDATHPDGWWYDGGGIYRHVWLTVADPLHIVADGVFANVTVSDIQNGGILGTGDVDAQTEVVNDGSEKKSFQVLHRIIDGNGKVVETGRSANINIESNSNITVHVDLNIPSVKLWSDIHPVLYTLETNIFEDGNLLDSLSTTFGFRKIEFTADKGFLINGIPTKIRGLANHQDFAGVGVAVPDSLQKFRVGKLKEMGANGWRTAHNPPTPALLDECDKQGMFVWDENHRNKIEGQFIDDLRFMMRRDRNHPSIVLWSLCNEALCQSFDANAAKILKPIVKEYDEGPNARPVTAAQNGEIGSNFSFILDVIGINYHISEYKSFHQTHPYSKLIGSETASALSDRGIYKTDGYQYVSAYDVNNPGWGATAEDAWQPILADDWMAGCFIWTGFDYKGEPTPYKWPNINSHFGIIDIAGFPKDSFWYYKANWGNETLVHCLPHWNWEETEKCEGLCSFKEDGSKSIEVWAYSNTDSVEVWVNGKNVGEEQKMPTASHVKWNIDYQPGSFECRGLDESGKVVALQKIETAGKPAGMKIEIEQGSTLIANNDDVALLKVSIVDAKGNFVPTASNIIEVDVTGPGQIIGVGNGDPSCHEPDKSNKRSAWNGLMRGIIQAGSVAGDIIVTISSDGLPSQKVVIKSQTAPETDIVDKRVSAAFSASDSWKAWKGNSCEEVIGPHWALEVGANVDGGACGMSFCPESGHIGCGWIKQCWSPGTNADGKKLDFFRIEALRLLGVKYPECGFYASIDSQPVDQPFQNLTVAKRTCYFCYESAQS